MIQLYSFRRCPFAIRVRMVLEEKGLSYEVIEESLRSPSAALLSLNPSGKVPVLVHNGRAIPESAVITAYLEKNFPEPPLRHSEEPAWTLWCDQELKPDLDLFKYKWQELEGQEELLARLRMHLQKLENALEKNDFLLGAELTLADIHVFPFFRQLEKCPHFSQHLEAKLTSRWLAKIIERPSFGCVMRK